MLAPEIIRTRRWIVASAALLLLVVPSLMWLATGDRPWIAVVAGAGVLLLAIILIIVESVASLRSQASQSREAGYRLVYGRFIVPLPALLGATILLQVLVLSMFTTMFAGGDFDVADLLLPVVSVFNFMVAIFLTPRAWRGSALELSPQGIESRSLFGRRVIPWEALALGGPPRSDLGASRIELIVSRPELVTQSGWAAGQGTRERPFIGLNVAIHPWFLADSIAWYVANPAERAAIGTEAGHARLLTALSADSPPVEPSTAPPLSPQTRWAVLLTYAGVAFGLIAMAVDIAVPLVFRDELNAADAAMRADEIAHTGMDPGSGSSADFALGWAIGGLVLALLFGLVAVLLAGAVRRGQIAARIPLIVICAIVAAWALCPCGSPSLSIMDAPGTDLLGSGLLLLWMAERGVIFLAALGVILLLLLPNRSQPPAAP